MSFLDAALENYKAPAADDLDIALPARREPKKDVAAATAEPQELGQHGGGADGTPAANDTHSDVVAGGAANAAATNTGAEPEPQRDDPDDGEHTDSNEGELAARARKAAARDTQGEDEPSDTQPAPEPQEVVEPVLDQSPAAADDTLSVRQKLGAMSGTKPQVFQRIGFSAGADAAELTVKRFPQELVDHLRLELAPAVGGEFAEAMSAAALITAFLVAKTGVKLDVDSNTAAAVAVYRQADPRLLSVEDKIDNLQDNVLELANAMKLSLKRIATTGNVVDSMDFSVAYLVADRVSGLTTADTDESNVDVTQKKVLVARENIRARSKAQRTIEEQRAGRSNA